MLTEDVGDRRRMFDGILRAQTVVDVLVTGQEVMIVSHTEWTMFVGWGRWSTRCMYNIILIINIIVGVGVIISVERMRSSLMVMMWGRLGVAIGWVFRDDRFDSHRDVGHHISDGDVVFVTLSRNQ